MTSIWQDIRFAIRLLVKNPGFTAIAVLTLALGIGANTAVFSVTDQILLRPLPVESPHELVVLRSPGPTRGRVWSDGDSPASFSYPMYERLAQSSGEVADLLARFGIPLSVSVHGQAERASGELVSGNYFEVLRVRPALGRVFNQEDNRNPGAHPLAVLSHGYWMRRFAGDPSVLNETILVNDVSLTVVGVARQGFWGVQVGQDTDIFIPITMKAQMTPNWDGLADWNDYWLSIMGRMKPGLTREAAEQGLTLAYRPLLEEHLSSVERPFTGDLRERFLKKPIEAGAASNGRPILQADTGTPLVVVSAIVGLVLLIACANVANLLIARGVTRQREIALRLAMGGSRRRLMRQMLVESLLLAFLGASLGLVIAMWTSQALIAEISANMGATGLAAALDLRVLVFTMGIALLTGLLFGLLPAWRATRPDLLSTLKAQSGSVSLGKTQIRFRKVLVTAQIALTLALLVAAGLLSRSFYNVKSTELGLRPQQVLLFSISPELSGYDPARTAVFADQLRQSLQALPGVQAASSAVVPVLDDSISTSNITAEGHEPQEGESTHINNNWVGPDFFATLGMTLLEGRGLRESDRADSPKVAVINETMAERFFPDRTAVGSRFAFGAGDSIELDIEIVGLVRDSKHGSVQEEIQPFAYLPVTQLPSLGNLTFYVRSSGQPREMAESVRTAVRRIDPNLPIYDLKTFETQIAQNTSAERILMVLSGSFGALAALLAAIGLSGVMAYNVARRTREIGIRMALGARPGKVQRLVLREVAFMVLLGLAVGLPSAYALALYAESVLFEVQAGDPAILLGAALTMAAFAFLSGYLPARRAANVNPVVALRTD